MSRIRIIPVLLLDKGGLYKTVRFKNPGYIGDPINAVKIFNEKEADEIILLDYRASKEQKEIDFKKIEEIAGEAFMPMGYGGGIKSFSDAQKVFNCGYEKIILNSILFSNLKVASEIAAKYGDQAVVGAIDIRKNIFGKYKVFINGGSKNTGIDPLDWAKRLEDNHVGELFLNNIDKDGTWEGYDSQLISLISRSLAIPLIACGGASNFKDFSVATEAGASAAAAGSMFVYQKKGMGVLINFPSEMSINL